MERVHIDLPNHWAVRGETLWATPLGNDLYQIENIPCYAYGLNFHDVVRAKPDPDGILEAFELVELSGHRTFRIFFRKNISEEIQDEVLSLLKQLTISYERASKLYCALDMKPIGNYRTVYNRLEELDKQDILGFETCEARIEGSFDDLPEEEEN